MTSLDIIILVILGFAFFIGYQQGFIKSVISLLGWVLGAYAAILFGEQMTEYLKKNLQFGKRHHDLDRISECLFNRCDFTEPYEFHYD